MPRDFFPKRTDIGCRLHPLPKNANRLHPQAIPTSSQGHRGICRRCYRLPCRCYRLPRMSYRLPRMNYRLPRGCYRLLHWTSRDGNNSIRFPLFTSPTSTILATPFPTGHGDFTIPAAKITEGC